LLQPGDAGYDEARRVHNGLVDKRPALIARCHGMSDDVDFVKLGRELGLEVAVRGGGHNVAGRATVDNGLMIDLAPMKGSMSDPSGKTVWAQGGGHLGRTQPRDAIARLGGDCAPTVTTFL
jgi:FAD/FMN-containing dehydrogenase